MGSLYWPRLPREYQFLHRMEDTLRRIMEPIEWYEILYSFYLDMKTGYMTREMCHEEFRKILDYYDELYRYSTKSHWHAGVMGLVVGDALGCPVQFYPRDLIKNRSEGPVTGMESGGVFDMPEGTWTDDSSLTIATMLSIYYTREIDCKDIMNKFSDWLYNGRYTPYDKAFDIGNTCLRAIGKYKSTKDVTSCGVTGERANGNGALMRILPICIYYYDMQQIASNCLDDEAIEVTHKVCGLTHNHLRSKICCGIYYFCVKNILDGINNDIDNKPELITLLQQGIDMALKYYGTDKANFSELSHLGRLFDLSKFRNVGEEDILSTGYVIDTLEAAIWSLITTTSYKECVLKAVNLGDDADTVAAVAGGLAGLYYSYEAIPEEWLAVIKNREWLEKVCRVTSNRCKSYYTTSTK